MKSSSLLFAVLALAGCTDVLSTFEGWSTREIPDRKLVLNVGRVWSDRSQEALYYAALVTARRGHRFFTIQEEDGRGDSRTRFAWRKNDLLLTDVANPAFVSDFDPGAYFTVIPLAAAGDRAFDSKSLIAAFEHWKKDSFP